MFKIIKDLPDDVLGIEVSGKVTHEDYIKGMIPAFENKLKKHKPMKVMYVISPDFSGMELTAMWDDMSYGLIHWNDISHMAVLSDEPWVRSAVAVFTPFFPGEVRFYDFCELDQARKWVEDPKSLAA